MNLERGGEEVMRVVGKDDVEEIGLCEKREKKRNNNGI